MDPMVNMWDLSHDSFAYYRNNADLYRELISNLVQAQWVERALACPGRVVTRQERNVYHYFVRSMVTGEPPDQ